MSEMDPYSLFISGSIQELPELINEGVRVGHHKKVLWVMFLEVC